MRIWNFISKLWSHSEPKQKLVNQPKTLEEAVDALIAEGLNNKAIDNPMFHFSGGMSIRNNLGLWDKNSDLYKHMQDRFGLGHADDTCHIITASVKAKAEGKTYDPTPDVLRFRNHWLAMNIDPKTQERIKT